MKANGNNTPSQLTMHLDVTPGIFTSLHTEFFSSIMQKTLATLNNCKFIIITSFLLRKLVTHIFYSLSIGSYFPTYYHILQQGLLKNSSVKPSQILYFEKKKKISILTSLCNKYSLKFSCT